MTIKNLINRLEQYNPDARIFMAKDTEGSGYYEADSEIFESDAGMKIILYPKSHEFKWTEGNHLELI